MSISNLIYFFPCCLHFIINILCTINSIFIDWQNALRSGLRTLTTGYVFNPISLNKLLLICAFLNLSNNYSLSNLFLDCFQLFLFNDPHSFIWDLPVESTSDFSHLKACRRRWWPAFRAKIATVLQQGLRFNRELSKS